MRVAFNEGYSTSSLKRRDVMKTATQSAIAMMVRLDAGDRYRDNWMKTSGSNQMVNLTTGQLVNVRKLAIHLDKTGVL